MTCRRLYQLGDDSHSMGGGEKQACMGGEKQALHDISVGTSANPAGGYISWEMTPTSMGGEKQALQWGRSMSCTLHDILLLRTSANSAGGYISWEMTPTSMGGEKQACISGESTSADRIPAGGISAGRKHVMHLHDILLLRTSANPAGGYISWEMTPTSMGGEKQACISGESTQLI